MRCKDVMTTLVFRCHEDDPVQKAARLMLEEEVGFIPITNASGRLAGVVTDRDLALRVLAEGRPADTPVCSVMSLDGLLTCRPDDDLVAVVHRMETERKSRAVVVESGQVVGVISATDIALTGGTRRAGSLMRALARRESTRLARS
jgi:CBS domain-containing protein